MITKQDITKLKKIFATKQELKLLDGSLVATRIEMNARFDEQDEKFETFRLKITDLVLTAHSEVMGELKAMREEHTIGTYRQREHSDQLEDHETRIVGLETKLS